MNKSACVVLLYFALVSNCFSSEEACSPPRDEPCMFYGLDKNHIGVLVNFKKFSVGQVVYLDGGCGIGVHKFTPVSRIKVINKYPSLPVTLVFTYCVGRQFINKETISVSSASAVLCSVSDKIVCNKKSE